MRAFKVRIHRKATTAREYNAITVSIADLHLSCDVLDGLMGDRQIRLAKKLADEHQSLFLYDEAMAARVREVLGIKA